MGCVYIYRTECLSALCTTLCAMNVPTYKLHATWRDWHSAGHSHVLLSFFRKNISQYLSPNLLFHSNQMSPKESTAPQIPQVFSNKKAWQGGEGTVSGCEEQESAAALCSSVRQYCTCMAGWVGLVQNSDVILPGFGFLSTLTLPTGSFAAVTQLLSRSLSPCMCVCVCSVLGHFLFATHMLLPVRSVPEWYELWKQWVVGCVPARVSFEHLFFASEGGQPWSLLCSLSRTTWTSSSRPAGS